MTGKVLILQHVPSEDAGTIREYLDARSIPVEPVALYEGSPIPPLTDDIRALVIMGGPMNVYEEEKYPFLIDEDRYIRAAIHAGVPCLGICLGAQLIAKAMGAKVYKASKPEIGWENVSLAPVSRQDPVFGAVRDTELKVLQWHEDTLDLPSGARLLASSPVCVNQAFKLGERTYGLQFHVEVNPRMLRDWFGKRDDLSLILSEYDAYKPKLETITRSMYDAFFSLRRGRV